MPERDPSPRMERIPDPHERKRITTTISSTDADDIPKVPNAGELLEVDGQSVQLMHNGVLIREGSYGGAWMTEIIRSLHGHHEPQEERVFHAIVQRLGAEPGEKHMIELGVYWAYYSLWFASMLRDAEVIGIEPDPNNLEVGRRNAELNPRGDRITFLHGAIGPEPGAMMTFVNESDGGTSEVRQYGLSDLLGERGWDSVDLVLADIQGAETPFLETARADLEAGRVRFLIVSTHHNSISGDPLTHQRALAFFRDMGAHIVAEHAVPESFSGDGLIAVAFRDEDRDLVVPVGFARARDSIFDELEWELDRAFQRERQLTSERDDLRGRAEAAESRLAHIEGSLTWRVARPLRTVYSRVRRAASGSSRSGG